MKQRNSLFTKIIAIILCLVIGAGASIQAFALEDIEDNEDVRDEGPAALLADVSNSALSDRVQRTAVLLATFIRRYESDKRLVDITKEIAQIKNSAQQSAEMLKRLEELNTAKENALKEAAAVAEQEAKSWSAIAKNYFDTAIGVVRSIGTVFTAINGAITLLKNLGIIKSENTQMDNILQGINTIQLTVDEIDKNVDEIQETLVSEFSELDLKFQEQDYNHFKDDVWAQFYTNAVLPLQEYQNEYNDDVRWLLTDFIEQYQDADDDYPTDLRALFGKDENGADIQVYSGKNIDDAGKALPREPKTSIDSVPVEFSVTLPAKYIIANFDKYVALTSDNCVDELIEALEKGIYQAAENKELKAYGGFDTVWEYLTEEEKRETAKEYAADLADALAFFCSYSAANERRFASNVKSAYQNFTKWTTGSESLTSPMYAQLKMLALTHCFEGEVTSQAEKILLYLMLMDMNYSTFTETVVSLSKAHGVDDCADIKDWYLDSESALTSIYSGFFTGNPNYCYQANKVLEYKNASVESEISFVFDVAKNIEPSKTYEDYGYAYYEDVQATPWIICEKDKGYSSNKKTAQEQKQASYADLMSRSISAKEAKLIYAMYETSGCDGDFADYLAENKVSVDAENITDMLITSFQTGSLDLNRGTRMKAYLPTTCGTRYVTEGNEYTVSGGVNDDIDDDDCYIVHDKVSGGMINMKNGALDENALIAARAFYGDDVFSNCDPMIVFSTIDHSCTWTKFTVEQQVEKYGYAYGMDEYVYIDNSLLSTDKYGVIVASEPQTYTFPATTEKIPDEFFSGLFNFKEIIFEGIPEEIGDNAFSGVGSTANRCLLTVPEGFSTGSLLKKWHGGYFGNIKITVGKNDGSDEEKTVVAVNGAPLSSIVNPFEAPEHRTFAGWSYDETTDILANSSDSVMAGLALYAVWKYDHEHEFEVSKEAVAATCIENGATAERTCKICGCEEYSVSIPAFGHSCVFEKRSDGNYSAVCTECGYSAILYPKNCSTFTVWCENTQNSDVTFIDDKYNGNSVSINKSGVYVIENKNIDSASSEHISVNDGIKASIGLAGVNIAPPQRVPAINSGNGTVHITLVDGTENRLTGGGDCPALQTGGNFIVDGGGSLIAVAAVNSALKASGMNTVLKSGRIYADGGEFYGIGIAGAQNNFVVSKDACVYSSNGLNAVPVNENGENVYVLCLDNKDNEIITVDGEELPYTSSPCDNNAYVYLTAEEHEIKIGDEDCEGEFINGRYYFEKEFGDFTVKYTNIYSINYEDGVLNITASDPVFIKNTDISKSTTDRIFIKENINADITLNGVNIVLDSESPIKIADNSRADVKITLADGSTNTLKSGYNCAGISKNGNYGTLTIDGKGTLNVTSDSNAAAIGSDTGKIVRGIIINDGVINATVNSYRAAAIGSGYVSAADAPGGEKVYTAAGIIINGGTITARAKNSAAIGAGDNDSVQGKTFAVKDITINGGTVNAYTENALYSIGAGVYASAENITINGGVVTAEGSGSQGGTSIGTGGASPKGGIGANLGAEVIIKSMASVKVSRDIQNPEDGEGNRVYLNVHSTDATRNIVIDGKRFPYTSHNGEGKVYIYLPQNSVIRDVPMLTVEESEKGTITVDNEFPAAGDKVKISAKANDGYVFKTFYTVPTTVVDGENTFIMPDCATTVKGWFLHIGTVTIKDCENCTVTPSKSIVTAGEKVTLRIVPDEGMEFSEWNVETGNVKINGNTFIMPEEDVTISCVCVPKPYTVTWNVDGDKTTDTLYYGDEITVPEDPSKAGYAFNGWSPEVSTVMPAKDLEYTAEFALETYYATFIADGTPVATVPYTVETGAIVTPMIPYKDGFNARWSDFTLAPGGVIVNAIYSANAHEHTFSTKYTSNEYMHWYASTCGHADIAKGLGEHTFGDGIAVGNSTIYICTECSYIKIVSNEIVELKEKAIAEIEAAAGTERSEAIEFAVELAELAIERATTAEEIESAKEDGLAVINASKDTFTLSDNEVFVAMSGTKTLTAAFPAGVSGKTVTWSSTNTDIATVNEFGIIIGKTAGITMIKATAPNGFVAYCAVKVVGIDVLPGAKLNHNNGYITGLSAKADSLDDYITVTDDSCELSYDSYATSSILYLTRNGEIVDAYTLVVTGDVNGDGVCDVLDAALCEQASNEHTELEGAFFAAGDLNESDAIDVNDYAAVVNAALA